MQFRLRMLLTRANGDRLFCYGSFVALFGGLMAIRAYVIDDGAAGAGMVAWACFMLVVVLAGAWLTRRLKNAGNT